MLRDTLRALIMFVAAIIVGAWLAVTIAYIADLLG